MEGAAAVVRGEKFRKGTKRGATARRWEKRMGISPPVRLTSDSVDGGDLEGKFIDDKNRETHVVGCRKGDSTLADVLPDIRAPTPKHSSDRSSNLPTRRDYYAQDCTKKSSNNGNKRRRLDRSYVLNVEISDRQGASSKQTKAHKQALPSKTFTPKNTSDEASTSTSKARSNPKSIGITSNKSLNDVLNNSIFRDNPKKSKEGSASKSSHSKSKSVGASASTKKSMGVSTSSTAKTRKTMRILSPRKNTSKSKCNEGKTMTTSPKQTRRTDSSTRNTSLNPPDTVTICAKKRKGNDGDRKKGISGDDGDIGIWEDEDEDTENPHPTMGVTIEKKVLCDSNVVNRVVRDGPMSNFKKHHLPMQRSNDRCRTKSARKKRKSVMEDVETDSKRRFVEVDVLDKVELSRPVHFVVPMFEAGRYGEDKYQERKYLGLIEGVGGGIEEKGKDSDIPHRGRLMELPGEIMFGDWNAQVLQDTSTEGLQSVRIALRHNSASYSSLEDYLHKEDGQVSVSMINPLKNRVKSFIDQNILDDAEIDDEVDGEERILNGAFISCISLVWFDGFTSASEAVNLANDVSENLLKLCVPAAETEGKQGLCKIVREDKSKDADELVAGVLFRTKLDFTDDYLILTSQRDFEIDAVDVIFKKIQAPSSALIHSNINDVVSLPSIRQRGLTPSLLSKHLDHVGSSVEDIMDRFQGKHMRNKNYDYNQNGITSHPQYNLHVVAKNANQGEPSESIRSEKKEVNESTSDNDSKHQTFQGFGERHDVFEPDVHKAMKFSPLASDQLQLRDRGLAEEDLFRNEQPGENKRERPTVSFRNTSLSSIHSTSPALDLDEETRAVLDSLGNAIAEKCSVQRDERIVELAEVKCMEMMTPQVDLTQEADATEYDSTPIVSNQAKKSYDILYDHDVQQSQRGNTCIRAKTMSNSSSFTLEAAKDTRGTANSEENIRDKKKVVRSEEQVGEHSVKTEDSAMERGHAEKIQEPPNDAEPRAGVIRQKNSTPRNRLGQEAKTSSHQVDNAKGDVFSAPSKLMDVCAPVISDVRSFMDKTVKQKSKASHTPKKEEKSGSESPDVVKSSTKKRQQVYVSDLFGENESLFGCPTITASARKKSGATVIEKDSHWRSSAPLAPSKCDFDNAAEQRVASLAVHWTKQSKATSPTVIPAVDDFVSLENEDEFHDTLSVLFEIPKNDSRVEGLSESMSSTTFITSPCSTQALHDSGFGQHASMPIDHSKRTIRNALQKMQTKHRSKLHFVVFLLWGILRGAMHPKVMTRHPPVRMRHPKVIVKNKTSSPSNTVFTDDSGILKDRKVYVPTGRLPGWF